VKSVVVLQQSQVFIIIFVPNVMSWDCTLNLLDAVKLLNVVSDFDFKAAERTQRFAIYDDQKEGHSIWVDTGSVSKEYRKHLEEIVKSRKLRIRELKGYFVISGY
jgi:hypothetical protein